MSESMMIKKEVYFTASQAEVWNLLTNPELTKQYMFGCEVLSDWQLGSEIIWKGLTEDGLAVVYVKGEIVAIEMGRRVAFTMFDPNRGLADVPENYVKLSYELTESGAGTELLLTQGDYAGAEDAEQRYEESVKGWDMVIPLMKELVEQ